LGQCNIGNTEEYHVCFQGLFQGLSLKAKARTEDLTLKARTKDIPTVLKESLSPVLKDRTKAKD